MNGSNWSSEWFKLARMDLDSAEFLLAMRPVPIEIICYHCAQAAEKMLKGVLVSFDIEPPKTHDLPMLCRLCSEADSSFESLLDFCLDLTPYGVQARYPSHFDIELSDMERALRGCKALCRFVEQKITPIEQEIESLSM